MTIYPNYIGAAREMYNKFGVDADMRAVETFDYNDPVTGNNIVLEVYWRMVVSSSGPAEVWGVLLPKPNVDKNDYDSVECAELGGSELSYNSKVKWNIDFQDPSRIVITAKTRTDLINAIIDCRECIELMIEDIPCAA